MLKTVATPTWGKEDPYYYQDVISLLFVVLSLAVLTASLTFIVWLRMNQVQDGFTHFELQRSNQSLQQEIHRLELEQSSLLRPERLQKFASQKDVALFAPKAEQFVHYSAQEGE